MNSCEFEVLASGYGLAEAPRYDDNGVYFSDVLGGGVFRWTPAGVVTIVPKRRGVGGLVVHADGGIVISGRDIVHVRDGDTAILAHAPEGVTGFNDMATDGEGRLYVGALGFRPFAGERPVPGSLWQIDRAGRARELFGDIEWPNGVGIASGGDTIYVCDYSRGEVVAHDIDGGNRRVLARSPSKAADGLALDAEGGVWIATGDGHEVVRFAPDGALAERIVVPAEFVSSLCFGGPDLRQLYVTTMGGDEGGALLRTAAPVAGAPVATYG